MSPSDRPTPVEPSAPAPAVPTALRRDGTAPRPLQDRLLMLMILTGISLAVAIPALLVNTFFAQHPKSTPPPAAQATPEPAAGLRKTLEMSAEKLLPPPAPLGAEPIVLRVRPDRLAARQEKVTRQAAQFGGTVTDGFGEGSERHLYVDLPAASVVAFRQAVQARDSVDAASPAPTTASPASGREHLEIFIRPTSEDE